METVSIKQEPVDDGYGLALSTTENHRESRDQYAGNGYTKPTGKSKLLKLLFSQDVPPAMDDYTYSSDTLSAVTDRNGSSVRIKSEMVDPGYEETTKNGSSVRIKTEVVDPEYEGTMRTEKENNSDFNGSNSKLFSLLSMPPDSCHSNHHTVSNLHTSHKNLSSLLSRPSMNHTFAARNAEFKANNLASKSCSTLLKMLSSPSMPSVSQGNNPSHVTQRSQSQKTSANSSVSATEIPDAFGISPGMSSCSQGNSPSHVTQRNQPQKTSATSNLSSKIINTSLGMPSGSQGNSPSHVTERSQPSHVPERIHPQNTAANSNLSANANLNVFDTTLRAMLEKPVPKNTSNKGLIELLNKDIEAVKSTSPKPDTGTRHGKTVRNRLDATINMLMSKSESNAYSTNETATNNFPTNGKKSNNYSTNKNKSNINPTNGKIANDFPTNDESSLMSGDMERYNQWIEQMSSFLTKQGIQSKQGLTVHGSPAYAASTGNKFVQSVTCNAEPNCEKTSVPNVILDKDGAMFITVKPKHIDPTSKKRGQEKTQILSEEEPGKKKQKKSFEYLKAELLKPNTKKVDIQAATININRDCGNTELSKKNAQLSSLLKFNPLNTDQNPPACGDGLQRETAIQKSQQVSPSSKEPILAKGPMIKQEPVENSVKCDSQIRSILQLPTLNEVKGQGQKESTQSALKEQLNAMTPKISSSQGRTESTLRESLNTTTPKISSGQSHFESTLRESLNTTTPKISSGRGHSESTLRESLNTTTSKISSGRSYSESTLRESLNTTTSKISSNQVHSESTLRKCLNTSNLPSSSQGHSKSKLNVKGQEKQIVITYKFTKGQGHPESDKAPTKNEFETQFPASSIMRQISESVGGQGHAEVESSDGDQGCTGGQEHLPNQVPIESTIIHKPGENPTYWIYKCKQCNKTFRHAGTLKVHERAHSFDREEFKCNICGKVCSAAGYLAIHMRTHFPEKPNDGVFTCTLCGDTFSERENLLIHLRMHSGEKLFKCEVCGTGFTRKTQLLIHMRIHTGEKPYQCEICNKTFRQSNGLNLHLTTHTDDKPYRCEICNKGFGRKAHYDKHMRKHRGERPFVCTECGKGFTDKFNLTMHTKIHNKEKDHICGICNKGYNQSSHLKNHMKFHTGELGYRCVYCYKSTEFKRELYTHFKGDHPELFQDYISRKKAQRYYEVLNPKFQEDRSLNIELEQEEEEESDEEEEDEEMVESDYESEAESGVDNSQSGEDVKPEISDGHTEYEIEMNTESQDILTDVKQEPMEG